VLLLLDIYKILSRSNLRSREKLHRNRSTLNSQQNVDMSKDHNLHDFFDYLHISTVKQNIMGLKFKQKDNKILPRSKDQNRNSSQIICKFFEPTLNNNFKNLMIKFKACHRSLGPTFPSKEMKSNIHQNKIIKFQQKGNGQSEMKCLSNFTGIQTIFQTTKDLNLIKNSFPESEFKNITFEEKEKAMPFVTSNGIEFTTTNGKANLLTTLSSQLESSTKNRKKQLSRNKIYTFTNNIIYKRYQINNTDSDESFDTENLKHIPLDSSNIQYYTGDEGNNQNLHKYNNGSHARNESYLADAKKIENRINIQGTKIKPMMV